MQQAWREKIALCLGIIAVMAGVAYFTVGMRSALCLTNDEGVSFLDNDGNVQAWRNEVIINGFSYGFEETKEVLRKVNVSLTNDWHGVNLNPIMNQNLDSCRDFANDIGTFCSIPNPIPNSPALESSSCIPINVLSQMQPKYRLSFDWEDIKRFTSRNLVVYNNAVLNLSSLNNERGIKFKSTLPNLERLSAGGDVTWEMNQIPDGGNMMKCFSDRYRIGYLGYQSPGCTVYNSAMSLALITILLLIGIRFVMALAFHWFVAPSLTKHRIKSQLNSQNGDKRDSTLLRTTVSTLAGCTTTLSSAIPKQLDIYTICLVTCYSEDKISVRSTLDSIALSDFPNERKLILVICDGLIQGAGNIESTPALVLGMINILPELGSAPQSYLAISDGENQHNMAQVYAGTYTCLKRTVPIVVIVKIGNQKEREGKNELELSQTKAGNRGKRDSQVILMNFLSRVNMDERMTPLDYDLFKKIHAVTGVTPDKFELLLMVDSDTTISRASLSNMVRCMANDSKIVGLCGETRISNKTESWVTMMQVYEYFTSHNLGKAFESIFGGVTCLPGCFCMYRIKIHEKSKMIPLLINPDIVESYSENVVDTLHKKNLLLLGEDRYLTTLLLGTFPRRKMIYVPQAICHTTVPHTYSMLQSQRRRWINSTIHNLFELVLLPTLCGTFCFSMQFVIAVNCF